MGFDLRQQRLKVAGLLRRCNARLPGYIRNMGGPLPRIDGKGEKRHHEDQQCRNVSATGHGWLLFNLARRCQEPAADFRLLPLGFGQAQDALGEIAFNLGKLVLVDGEGGFAGTGQQTKLSPVAGQEHSRRRQREQRRWNPEHHGPHIAFEAGRKKGMRPKGNHAVAWDGLHVGKQWRCQTAFDR